MSNALISAAHPPPTCRPQTAHRPPIDRPLTAHRPAHRPHNDWHTDRSPHTARTRHPSRNRLPLAAAFKTHLEQKPDTANMQMQYTWNGSLFSTSPYLCASLLLPKFGKDASRMEECSRSAAKINPPTIRPSTGPQTARRPPTDRPPTDH